MIKGVITGDLVNSTKIATDWRQSVVDALNTCVSDHRTLHVLPDYRDIYNKTNYWINFNIVEDAEDSSYGIEKIIYYSDGLNDFYNLSGQKMKQANGIVIIKTSNGSKKMLIK